LAFELPVHFGLLGDVAKNHGDGHRLIVDPDRVAIGHEPAALFGRRDCRSFNAVRQDRLPSCNGNLESTTDFIPQFRRDISNLPANMRLSAEAGILSHLEVYLYMRTARAEVKTSFPLLSVTTKEGAPLNISSLAQGSLEVW